MSKSDISALSKPPELDSPPRRVVSLIPSMTESLFDLGFGETVVGITDYCVHPAEKLTSLPRLGGSKNPRVDEIIGLKPDLVFVNQEENAPQVVQDLVDAGLNIWMTFPQTVDQALDILRNLLAIYHTDAAAMQINSLQMAVDWARNASVDQPKLRYFCPIWQDETQAGQPWWMTFNRNTYADDLMATFGCENIFAGRERRYPLDADLGSGEAEDVEQRDTRYPRVTLEEIEAAQPEFVLLPSEPFAFDVSHKLAFNDILSSTPAVKNDRVLLVDGSLITWHGTRLAKAVSQLPSLLSL
jgi:ABC-type Fe3+-hydroxamate transport system substrate-binding protein